MYLERGNAMQSFWGFYLTISVGLVALFGNVKWWERSVNPVHVAAMVSTAFVMFAWVNYAGMSATANQRRVLYEVLVETVKADTAQVKADWIDTGGFAAMWTEAKPPQTWELRFFHVTVDVLVLAAIWIFALAPQRGASGH